MENPTFPGQGQTIPGSYDYKLYDRVWQRVSPDLNPYPDVRAEMENASQAGAAAQMGTAATQPPEAYATAAQSQMGAVPQAGAVPSQTLGAPMTAARQESEPAPGANPDPCCMGTAAQEATDVLVGYIDEELIQRQYVLSLLSQFPRPDVRRLLRQIAVGKWEAARKLKSAYYLITGEPYAPMMTTGQHRRQCLRESLRELYHQEACNGFNYLRSADDTMDPCLRDLLTELSQDAYQRAREILSLIGCLLS